MLPVLIASCFAWLTPPAADAPPAGLDLHAEGERLIEALPEIKLGVTRYSFLEARSGDKPNGVSRGVLRPEEKDGRRFYIYESVSIMRGANGETLEVIADGRLDRYFCPIEINWTIRRYVGDGKVTTSREALRVTKEEIILTKTPADADPAETRHQRPTGRFVYLTGDLLCLLDLKPGMLFKLREIDPETGKVFAQTYRTREKDDGRLRIGLARQAGGIETEYFIRDRDDHIGQHEVHGTAMRFYRVDPTRLRGLEKALRRYLPAPPKS